MALINYSFQFDEFERSRMTPELRAEAAKKASDNFTMHLTALFHTLYSVSDILQDEYKMVSTVEKMWKAKISSREYLPYLDIRSRSMLSFESLLSLVDMPSTWENERLLGPDGSSQRKRHWIAIKNRNKSKAIEAAISEFDTCAQVSDKLNLLSDATNRIEPTFIYEICQKLLTELASRLTIKLAAKSIIDVNEVSTDTTATTMVVIDRRIRKHFFYRSFQIILFASRCSGIKKEQADSLFQLHSDLINNTVNAANSINAIEEFTSIFQLIDTKSMIQVFRSQNTTENYAETSIENTVHSKISNRGISSLPTALVSVVNEYCCLNPLSLADAAFITTNLLK